MVKNPLRLFFPFIPNLFRKSIYILFFALPPLFFILKTTVDFSLGNSDYNALLRFLIVVLYPAVVGVVLFRFIVSLTKTFDLQINWDKHEKFKIFFLVSTYITGLVLFIAVLRPDVASEHSTYNHHSLSPDKRHLFQGRGESSSFLFPGIYRYRIIEVEGDTETLDDNMVVYDVNGKTVNQGCYTFVGPIDIAAISPKLEWIETGRVRLSLTTRRAPRIRASVNEQPFKSTTKIIEFPIDDFAHQPKE